MHSPGRPSEVRYRGEISRHVLGRPFFALRIALPMGILTPIKYTVPWAHPNRYSERHHDRFRHFSRAHGRDRQTDRPRYNVCSNRPHLASAATIITSNFTQGRIAAAHGRFNRIRQCPPCEICFHQPTRVLNPNGISIGSAILYSSFPLKIVPSHGDVDFHLIHASLGSPESITQTAWESQRFLQGSQS